MLPTVPVMRMQIIMEMQLIMGTQPVETPPGTPPAQHLLVAAVATAICTGRDIWQDSMPTTAVIVRLRQGRLPGQQAGPLRLRTAAAPAITAIIAAIGTTAAIGITAAPNLTAAPELPAA